MNYLTLDFQANKDALNKELEHFISLLEEMLPRYAILLRKPDINSDELKELGEIEHFLIDVNSKISVIKGKLEQDLFGHSLDMYYKLKAKAIKGDQVSAAKLKTMREIFEESLEGGSLINWN
jgi:hypothetical protein